MTEFRARWRGSRMAVSLLVLGILSALSVPMSAAAAVARPARSAPRSPDVHFVQLATQISVVDDTTYINNKKSNGNPRALIFVTPNWNPVNNKIGLFDTSPIGVRYNSAKKRWGIFNEDGSGMQSGEAFNVLIVPKPTKNAFVHTATASSIDGAASIIKNAATNGKSHLLLQVTQNLTPPGQAGMSNANPVGAAYSASKHRWTVFQDSGADMTVGAAFNVLVGTSGTGARSARLTASTGNLEGDNADFRNRHTNNDFRAQVFVTVTYAGLYVGVPLGAFYDKLLGRPYIWSVLMEDHLDMPAGATFYLLYYTR
jgi:hypothetical protein